MEGSSLSSQAFPIARNCKAWDETSREGRRWVDVLVRAAVGLIHKLYV